MAENGNGNEKALKNWISILIGILVLCSYAVGLGYNIQKISDHDRRLSLVEDQLRNNVTPKDELRDQLDEIKKELDKLDDKVDRISAHQTKFQNH